MTDSNSNKSPSTRRRRSPTSLDVAKAAGVSQSAVSRAFSDSGRIAKDKREKIRTVAAKLGYTPNLHARSLVTRETGMIGLVIGDITNPFYPEVLECFAERLQQSNKRLMLYKVSRDEPLEDVLPALLQQHVDGLVIASALPGRGVTDTCHRLDIPVVLFNRTLPRAAVSSISCDNYAGGSIVADTLLQAGCRRMAFIAGLEDASTSVARERGFRDYLTAEGATLVGRENGNFTYEGGYQATLRLLRNDVRPDGLFVANDIMALGALDVLRHETNLRVPQDVSVVGFDDIPAAAWPSYALTTFRQPINRMINEAIRMLEEAGRHPDREPATIMVPGRLISRATVQTS